MKRIILLLGILIVLAWGVFHGDWRTYLGKVLEETRETPIAGTGQADGMSIRITKDQVYKGSLLLVNKDYPVPKGGADQKNSSFIGGKELSGYFSLADSTVHLTKWMAERLVVMFEAAAEDGVKHFRINSGYRSEKEQSRLHKQMGDQYAMPAGFSEHNMGLSVDIGSALMEMNKAPEGEWLQKNAWQYGFVLRYPKNKTEITGIRYEPWHFRYVGLPHSAIMQQNNLVLEEYLDELKEKKSITVKVGSQRYGLFYYHVTGDTTVQVPAKGRYELSGDNREGVVITVML
jgi:zinc D-Ala-D-Ala carboxypeptidase